MYSRQRIISFLVCISLFVFACEKQDESGPGFADAFTGEYKCLETYYYVMPGPNGEIIWNSDTISNQALIRIEKLEDSVLIVSLSESYSFFAEFIEDSSFVCPDCPGPPNYVRFIENDSIYVFQKMGVTNSKHYYGRKIVPE